MKLIAVLLVVAGMVSHQAHAECGIASKYGNENGQSRRADGKRYNPHMIGCAHRTRRLGSVVTVSTGKRSIRCPINDRGPYVRKRILDLSLEAALALGIPRRVGTVRVCIY